MRGCRKTPFFDLYGVISEIASAFTYIYRIYVASLITLAFEMEFSALEPLKVDIQIQYILLKSPLDKDSPVEVIAQIVSGVYLVLRSGR